MAWDIFVNQPVVSIGGGYIRVWRPGKGLTVELPTCVVVQKETGEVAALGEEAAELEGKLPPTLRFVRPFWGDRIVNRVFLRLLLQEALQRDRQTDTSWLQSGIRRYKVRVPESLSALHKRWIITTCREVWPIPWKEEGAFASMQTRPGAKADVGVYMDIGFSALHVGVLVGKTVIVSRSQEELSLQRFCERLCLVIRAAEHVRLAPAAFYTQQWLTQQAGFHEKDQQPVLFTLSKTLFHQEIEKWARDMAAFLEQALLQAPPDVRSQVSRTGVALIGGGAESPELMQALEKKVPYPVHVVRQPKYAVVREKGV